MRTKIIFILLLISLSSFSYILPYFQQQSVYFKETIKRKSYNKIHFKANEQEYTINNSTIKSEEPLLYVLSNLFIYHEKALTRFLKKHKINSLKKYYTLFNDTPTVVYGNDKKTTTYDIDNLKSEIWLDNEHAYPVKVVFKLNDKLVIAEFNEYYNSKYKYMFPSKVTLTVNGDKTVYELTTF